MLKNIASALAIALFLAAPLIWIVATAPVVE
jgi:hypothetical protein